MIFVHVSKHVVCQTENENRTKQVLDGCILANFGLARHGTEISYKCVAQEEDHEEVQCDLLR
jgi:hypothetical protein